MISWFSRNRTALCPTSDVALRATRHLSSAQKRNLFSEDPGTMKAAEGRWYEAMIYEMVLSLSARTDSIRGVVGKGADARGRVHKVGLNQNGLLHSRSGDIKIRGNGQDLAEIDLLLIGIDGSLVFGEIVTSPANIKEIESEIEYKKRLLGYLFGQDHVPFILFASVDISRTATVRRLLNDPDNTFIATISCEEIRNRLNTREIHHTSQEGLHHPKLMNIKNVIPVRPFDYKQLHDMKRRELLGTLLDPRPPAPPNGGEWSPVKKVILGAPYPNAVRALTSQLRFKIGDHVLSPEEFDASFSKVVVAMNLPDYEPVFYLKRRGRREYLKMVRQRDGSFRCEGERSRKMLGFFIWLESVQSSLGTDVTRRLLASPYFSSLSSSEKRNQGSSPKASPHPHRKGLHHRKR